MDQNRIKRNQMLGAKIVKELTARNMEAYYTDSKEEALKKALELIPEGSSISWGGSMSVNEIGLKEAVCQGNYQVYNRDTAPTPEDKRKIELAAYDCDYFLTSANAITEDGIMINIDGHSNRVSSIAAGPRNVLMIIGMNKVTRDVDSAMSRARNEAAPDQRTAFQPEHSLLQNRCLFRLQNTGYDLLSDPDHQIFQDTAAHQSHSGK